MLYQHDDGNEPWKVVGLSADSEDGELEEVEFAQRYMMPRPGLVEYIFVCVARIDEDTTPTRDFHANIYEDRSGSPGRRVGRVPGRVVVEEDPAPGTATARRLDLSADAKPAYRGRTGGSWEPWSYITEADIEDLKAYVLRVSVNHDVDGDDGDDGGDDGDDGDDGEQPDPEPPRPDGEYTDCVPTMVPLMLDGHEVSMCWETPAGMVGDGKGGVWASGESCMFALSESPPITLAGSEMRLMVHLDNDGKPGTAIFEEPYEVEDVGVDIGEGFSVECIEIREPIAGVGVDSERIWVTVAAPEGTETELLQKKQHGIFGELREEGEESFVFNRRKRGIRVGRLRTCRRPSGPLLFS